MDYKKWIRSRRMRETILKCFFWVPDKQMLRLQYRIKTGRKLNLNHPQRFTEKLQWYKLYYRTPLMRDCADKYEVRRYVQECGLEDILVPIIGIYNTPDQIDFDSLPEKFVLKDTLGGGGNAVIICHDRKQFDIHKSQKQMSYWIKESTSYKKGGREWVYGGRKHRILIEQYLESDPEKGGLIDYKFFCFNGKCAYVYVIADRIVGKKAGFGIYTNDYQKLSVVRCDEKPLTREVNKPKSYTRMLEIAEKLAAPFPEARIDLYYVENKILFGEITFFDGSGYMSFKPDEFDYVMGKKFILPE